MRSRCSIVCIGSLLGRRFFSETSPWPPTFPLSCIRSFDVGWRSLPARWPSTTRRLDERRQRALWRYYSDAGAGGIAVGVHTTQFAIRDPQIGLYEPVLALAADEFDRLDRRRAEPLVRIAGICGPTPQAVREAQLARELGYHAGLLSLGALRDSDEQTLVNHCRAVAEVIPVFGFYLQPAVGGRVLPYSFWRQFATIDNLAGDQDRAVQPLPDTRRGPCDRRQRSRRHRSVHRQR